MSTQVQFRRGTTTQNNAFTGAAGELSVDTDLKTIRLHDGTTAGGGSTMLNNTSAQTALNKTFSTGSVWQGTAVGLAYGGTGSALTAVAGAIPYSTANGLGLTAAGTSGQILVSGGLNAPTWVPTSSISAGSSTLAATATNIAGGSAGQLVIQADTGLSTFITAGPSGTFLRSAGAGYAPQWATADVTIGSTVIDLGQGSTSLAGLNILAATGTSHWTLPVGTTAQRPATPSIGMVRYNSTQATFEGYSSGAWSSLGGVKSVDALTFIRAETSAGASNGDLDFFAEDSAGTAATQIGQWNRTNLKDYTGTLVGTQTTQNVFNITATTVNAFGAATTLALGATTGTTTVRNSLVVTGDLTINGTTTTVNATTITVDDKNIELGSVATPTNVTADGGGITLKGATDKTFNWVNATSAWTSSEHLALAAGKTLVVGGSTSGTTTVTASATASGTLTLPATTDTLVGKATTDTLTNKTIVAASNTITGLTNANLSGTAGISNANLANSTISGVSLGGTLATLTMNVSGTGLSGSTTYNGSGAATFTVASNATNLNTASTIVARDASGNFSAGTITATLSGNTTGTHTGAVVGNADTATKLATARTIAFTGDATASGTFDGSANYSQALTLANSGVTAGSYTFSNITVDAKGRVTAASSNTVSGTSANTANTLVQRDASGNSYHGTLFAGAFQISSDERLKSNIQESSYGLKEILALNSVQYDKGGRHEIGLIAQQVEPLMPEFVADGADGYKSLNYNNMVSVLIKAVQELSAEVNALKAKLGE